MSKKPSLEKKSKCSSKRKLHATLTPKSKGAEKKATEKSKEIKEKDNNDITLTKKENSDNAVTDYE